VSPHRRTGRSFRQLFELVPCYITVQDREFRILESNALFRQDFGDRLREHCYRAYKGRDAVCPNCPVEKTFATGEVHTSEENVVTRDGRQASMVVRSMPVRDENEQIVAVMEVSTNITDVKRMQRELALMGTAVAGMAHRIKNILMGLEGGIFVVNTGFETSDPETVNEGWEMVQRNVAHVSRLVKDLLYCSRERQPQFQEGVSPAAIVREVHELFRARTEAEGIPMNVEIDEASKCGRFDRADLRNLLENLVANAVDACRFDPTEDKQHVITLRCYAGDAEALILEVSDNGVGIPDDAGHKVFENFFSTKGTEGTGLGLLVVQKVAEEHGGHVSFSTQPGEGTTFRVVLPCAGAASPGPSSPPR
jgi:signal transduction histidine kinase